MIREINRLRTLVRCLSEVIIYCENNEPKEVFSFCGHDWQAFVRACKDEKKIIKEEENFISFINY